MEVLIKVPDADELEILVKRPTENIVYHPGSPELSVTDLELTRKSNMRRLDKVTYKAAGNEYIFTYRGHKMAIPNGLPIEEVLELVEWALDVEEKLRSNR